MKQVTSMRMVIAAVVTTALASFGGAAHVGAQVVPRDQKDADIAYSADRDQFILVWVEDSGAGNRVMARRVGANGLPVGGLSATTWELTGPTGTGVTAGQKGDQRNPVVVEGLVLWSEMAPGGADYDVYGQRLFTNFRANGTPKVIAGGPGNQAFPDVVANSRNGEWLVVWSEDATDAGDVMGMRLGSALTPRSKVFEVAKGMGIAEDPSIARDLTDKDAFLVVFADDRNGNRDIFGTRVTESGLPLGGSRGGAFEVMASPEDDYAPQLVFNQPVRSAGTEPGARNQGSRTRNILVWTRDDVVEGPNVMGLRLNNNGLPQGGPFVVAGGLGQQSWPSGALRNVESAREEFLVVYQQDALGNLDIVGQDLGLNGASRRAPWLLVTD